LSEKHWHCSGKGLSRTRSILYRLIESLIIPLFLIYNSFVVNYIIYDLEATCWENRHTRLQQETIEIGAICINSYCEVTGSFNRFVKPIMNPYLSPFCMQLTSITQEEVNRASTFDVVSEEFQDWIGIFEEPYALCSWGDFDQKLLVADCQLHHVDADWLDTYANLKKQYARLKNLGKPIGLMRAIRREGFEFEGTHHRGIDDAENLSKIFMKYFEEWDVERVV